MLAALLGFQAMEANANMLKFSSLAGIVDHVLHLS